MKMEHIGIAVRSIEERLSIYRDLLGMRLLYIKEVPDQRVRVAVFDCNGIQMELLEAVNDQSPVHAFIKKRGEGIHHICVQVENIERTLTDMKSQGVRLIDEVPRTGASGKKIAFVHPKDMGGVLVELTE